MDSPREKLSQLKTKLRVEEKEAELERLSGRLRRSATWRDWKKGNQLAKRVAQLKQELEDYQMLELLAEAGDQQAFEKLYQQVRRRLYLLGEHSKSGAILTVRAGQGGTEACDWAEMVARMYERFAKKRGWDVVVVSLTPGEEAGISKAVYEINGDYAYGYLRNEQGTHRLVRQSPFNAQNKRQTSFVAVEVVPQIDDNLAVEIDERDIQFSAFRSGGKGGQNVNKVSTAVRLKHLPSGITVECQQERSQIQNRQKAMAILRAKLYAKKRRELAEKKAKLRGDAVAGDWGTQIRSYILHPYKLVKDLRTGVEDTSPDKVLDGDLDRFIEAELVLP